MVHPNDFFYHHFPKPFHVFELLPGAVNITHCLIRDLFSKLIKVIFFFISTINKIISLSIALLCAIALVKHRPLVEKNVIVAIQEVIISLNTPLTYFFFLHLFFCHQTLLFVIPIPARVFISPFIGMRLRQPRTLHQFHTE